MDTRNVVEVLIYVFVMDIQDTPPIFVRAPPVTVISDTLDIVIFSQHLKFLYKLISS